jgi:hypothetical protein
MMGTMKPVKRSVAVIVRWPAGQPVSGPAGPPVSPPARHGTGPGDLPFLIVRRPDDPADPLARVWGLPAVTLRPGEDERAAAVRAGRVKLGVELAVGARIGEKTADRGDHVLLLADYEAVITAGEPSVPQPDTSLTQYTACRFTANPADLAEAAERGSACAQVFLERVFRERPQNPSDR